MLQAILIGNLGATAQKQSKDGRKFTTFRVAHNETWTDENGAEHNETRWVDCVLNDHPKVADYLLSGTSVFIQGSLSARVFSSQKDRCMKAGLQIRVHRIELIGSKRDDVPSRLFDQDGIQHDVQKFYHTDVPNAQLISQQNGLFKTDENGWVFAVATEQNSNENEANQSNVG